MFLFSSFFCLPGYLFLARFLYSRLSPTFPTKMLQFSYQKNTPTTARIPTRSSTLTHLRNATIHTHTLSHAFAVSLSCCRLLRCFRCPCTMSCSCQHVPLSQASFRPPISNLPCLARTLSFTLSLAATATSFFTLLISTSSTHTHTRPKNGRSLLHRSVKRSITL